MFRRLFRQNQPPTTVQSPFFGPRVLDSDQFNNIDVVDVASNGPPLENASAPEKVKTLKCYSFINKSSIARVEEHNIFFTVDLVVSATLLLHKKAEYKIVDGRLTIISSSNEQIQLEEGLNIPCKFTCPESEDFAPIIIEIRVPQYEQSFITICDTEFKVTKQILFQDGIFYVIHDVYGIPDDRSPGTADSSSADDLSTTRECTVCMSEVRDTIVLPCRHMCLCKECGERLRHQSNKCPICRQNFTSLLCIKRKQKDIKQ